MLKRQNTKQCILNSRQIYYYDTTVFSIKASSGPIFNVRFIVSATIQPQTQGGNVGIVKGCSSEDRPAHRHHVNTEEFTGSSELPQRGTKSVRPMGYNRNWEQVRSDKPFHGLTHVVVLTMDALSLH